MNKAEMTDLRAGTTAATDASAEESERVSNHRHRRHCMVVHAYYPVGETRVQRQALALHKQGYEVDVLCLRQPGEAARGIEEGINVYRLPIRRGRGGFAMQLLEYLAFFLLASLALITLYLKKRYGVVQVHNLPDFLVFAALLPRLLGARLILDLHDLMPEFFASRTGRPLNSLPVRLVIWQEQLSCRFAHHVITVTDVWKETLVQRGVPAEKISVIMNLADLDIFRRQQHEPPGNRTNGLQLIYHGTLTHRYGVDLALYALDQVRRQVPDIHLSLLGGGDYRHELQQIISELHLEQHVTLSSGMLPASELPPLLARADIGLVPNRSNIFTDGLLPTKLLEYVAMGIPVIAARTPTMAAYFDPSMVAFFTPGDAGDLARQIVALHTDRQRLAQLAQNAGKFSKQYNWEKMAVVYVSLVEWLNKNRASLQPSW